jgi:hypothetical protein
MASGDGSPQRREDDLFLKGSPKGFRPGGAESTLLEPGAMIQIPPQIQIWMMVEAVDFRRGIDGLPRVCRGLGSGLAILRGLRSGLAILHFLN